MLTSQKIKYATRQFTTVALDITNYCNSRCVFCLNEWDDAPCNMTEEVMKKVIQVLPFTQDGQFHFSYIYEPTIHPEFFSLLNAIPIQFKDKCFFTTNLVRKMSDEEIIFLAQSPVSYINISLETFSDKLYFDLSGNESSYFYYNLERICEIFTKFKNAPRIHFITMVLSSNYEELEAIALRAMELIDYEWHEFRVPYFFHSKDNNRFFRELLEKAQIEYVFEKLNAINPGKIICTNKDKVDKNSYKKMLKEYVPYQNKQRFSYGDRYTVTIHSDGTGFFMGNQKEFDLKNIDWPFEFFSNSLLQLQENHCSDYSKVPNLIVNAGDFNLNGFLDEAVLYDKRFLALSGWCYSAAIKNENTGEVYVRLKFCTKDSYTFAAGKIQRPDVCEVFQNAPLLCGFSIYIDMRVLNSEYWETCEVQVAINMDDVKNNTATNFISLAELIYMKGNY